MVAVVWAETPEDDRDDASETEAHGKVDETFASRRLRRWLKGMFGGGQVAEKPAEEEQER
ncbi:MAG TPA: hypothetical protein VIL91_08360 [Gaiellaceae bacterium]|jgi:hypothetical protein